MITENAIYWITRLDDIKTCFTVLSFVFGFGSLLLVTLTIVSLCADCFESVKAGVAAVITSLFCLVVFFCSLAGAVLCPTTNEMIVIKAVPAILNSNFVSQELPKDTKKLYEKAISILDKKLKEFDNDKKEVSK